MLDDSILSSAFELCFVGAWTPPEFESLHQLKRVGDELVELRRYECELANLFFRQMKQNRLKNLIWQVVELHGYGCESMLAMFSCTEDLVELTVDDCSVSVKS